MSINDILRTARWPTLATAPAVTWRACLFGVLHLSAVALMVASESSLIDQLFFVLAWGLLNFSWLTVLRRPAAAAALSLAMFATIIVLSRFKHEMILTTLNFLDVLVIDSDTVQFLLAIFPDLGLKVLLGALVAVPFAIWLWRSDRYRIKRSLATTGAFGCLTGLTVLAFAVPLPHWHIFLPGSYISKFARSGVESIAELATHGTLESAANVSDHLAPVSAACQPAGRLPHIILIHDESNFDVRAIPNVKVPDGYGAYFRSFDGKARALGVESNGGASWLAEYNVLAGLSSRSFGQFSYFLTRIAAGRVERGLPNALRRCGYRTFSFYPSHGAFMSARGFHRSVGIENFLDARAMGTRKIEADRFYYDFAAQTLAREQGEGPLFLYVYLAANHYPWDVRWHPDLTPGWHETGNPLRVDEYLRRQSAGKRDYAAFKKRLLNEFPTESFLIVRYGDHQPEFAAEMLEPGIDDRTLANRFAAFDARYFTTYYAIDAINFRPVDVSSASDRLDASYLPLMIQELAGVPLDPSFAEQKQILERCGGVFYSCAGGAEASRFNRLLIEAGLIKGL
jgi:hypothetical protein